MNKIAKPEEMNQLITNDKQDTYELEGEMIKLCNSKFFTIGQLVTTYDQITNEYSVHLSVAGQIQHQNVIHYNSGTLPETVEDMLKTLPAGTYFFDATLESKLGRTAITIHGHGDTSINKNLNRQDVKDFMLVLLQNDNESSYDDLFNTACVLAELLESKFQSR